MYIVITPRAWNKDVSAHSLTEGEAEAIFTVLTQTLDEVKVKRVELFTDDHKLVQSWEF